MRNFAVYNLSRIQRGKQCDGGLIGYAEAADHYRALHSILKESPHFFEKGDIAHVIQYDRRPFNDSKLFTVSIPDVEFTITKGAKL